MRRRLREDFGAGRRADQGSGREDIMFKRALFIATLMAPFAMAPSAQASISNGAAGVRDLTSAAAQIERVQFLFGGRNYCFYDDGWRGPGWYWCGYAFRRGFGWGGGSGWNGWHRHGGGHMHGGGMHRPVGGMRPGGGGHRPGGGMHRPGGGGHGGGMHRPGGGGHGGGMRPGGGGHRGGGGGHRGGGGRRH
jgi:hypothetical protein